MENQAFDRMTRAIATRLPRRTLAGLLGLGAAGLGASGLGDFADAKRKKKKVKRNSFNCVDVGKFCKNNGQCCSGLCQGKKKNKKCKAHDQSTCQPGQDECLGLNVTCTTTTGRAGKCVTTTGKAPYCYDNGDCAPCEKDSDCVALVGAGAACIVCADCLALNPQGTACVGQGLPL